MVRVGSSPTGSTMKTIIGLNRNDFSLYPDYQIIRQSYHSVNFEPHEREKWLLRQIENVFDLGVKNIIIPNIEYTLPIVKASPFIKAVKQIEKTFDASIIITTQHPQFCWDTELVYNGNKTDYSPRQLQICLERILYGNILDAFGTEMLTEESNLTL